MNWSGWIRIPHLIQSFPIHRSELGLASKTITTTGTTAKWRLILIEFNENLVVSHKNLFVSVIQTCASHSSIKKAVNFMDHSARSQKSHLLSTMLAYDIDQDQKWPFILLFCFVFNILSNVFNIEYIKQTNGPMPKTAAEHFCFI